MTSGSSVGVVETTSTPAAVIFDLGGVLVELGPLSDMLGDDAPPDEDFWPRWLHSAAVRDFEGGRCTAGEFGRRMVEEFSLSFGPDEMVERFRRWPKGLYEGAHRLVAEVKEQNDGVVIGLLSNSNPIHWQEQHEAEQIQNLFDRPFLSYEMGLIKPDAAVFVEVSRRLDVDPTRILYFDDNQLNVDAARRAGWRAELATGPHACRRVLAELGMVDSV